MAFILFMIQMTATVVVGVYFYRQLQRDRQAQPARRRDSARELEQLNGCGVEIALLDTLENALNKMLLPGHLLEAPTESVALPALSLTAQGAEQ